MVKKFCKLIGIFVALAILVLTPVPTLVQIGVAAWNSDDFHHTAPTQTNVPGSLGDYEISNWSKSLSENTTISALIATREDANNFQEEHPQSATVGADTIGDRKALVMTNRYQNASVNGSYTSSEISLSANGFYRVAVDYLVIGDNSSFYLNDYEISLNEHSIERNGNKTYFWDQSAFFIHTDRLETATIKVQLYLGSRDYAIDDSAVYYANFIVEALSEKDYHDESAKLADNEKVMIDLTNTADIKELKNNYKNENFYVVSPGADVDIFTEIDSHNVAERLNFTNLNTIKSKDGDVNQSVMLLAAHDSYAKLALKDKFKTTPRYVYMFQFYSLAASDNLSFYFNIGETPYNVKTIDYNYYYGWQLNTFFYIANDKVDQEYEISFSIGTESEEDSTATGWACITDLHVYYVSGSYATNNASAVGVHYTEKNRATDNATVSNGNFKLGDPADLSSPSYPYPLQAESWTTDGADNGIVNTSHWSDINAENPSDYADNNIYMMRNREPITNTLTSPTITTTAGSTTYLSFSAIAPVAAQAKVDLILDDMILSTMDINDAEWYTYEFAITESAYAASRSYQLRFTMDGLGETFIDNVRTGTTPEFLSGYQKHTATVNLNNPLAFAEIWQADVASPYVHPDTNGIMLQNKDLVTTTFTNTLAYSLTSGNYYKLTFNAYGQNAWARLSGFKGELAVNCELSDTSLRTYTLYFEATADTTQTNFTVLLGSQKVNEFANAQLFIGSFDLESITEVIYDQAVKQGNNDYRAVLTADTDDGDSDTTTDDDNDDDDDFWENFWSNWWFLIPSLITAVAIILAVIAFFIHRIKFDKHITTKTTSYARDVKMKTNKKKIVAEQSAKVDNSNTDEA